MAELPLQERRQLEKQLLEDLRAAEKVYKMAADQHRLMDEAYSTDWKISPDAMETLYESGRAEREALSRYMQALKAFGDLVLYGRPPAKMPAESARLLEPLTPRETEVLRLIAAGLSSKEIGGRLGISFKTVVAHRTRLMQKLNVHNVASLVRYAISNHLVDP